MLLSDCTTKTFIDNPEGLFFYGTASGQFLFVKMNKTIDNINILSWIVVDSLKESMIGSERYFNLYHQSKPENTAWQKDYILVDDYIEEPKPVEIFKRKNLIDAII